MQSTGLVSIIMLVSSIFTPLHLLTPTSLHLLQPSPPVLHQSPQIMNSRSSPFPFMLLLFVLTIGQFSICSYARKISHHEETDVRWKALFFPPSPAASWRFSSITPLPSPRDDGARCGFEDSKRTVPTGPNPLHH